jgi:oligopeptidase B
MPSEPTPPSAKQVPAQRTFHGDTVVDEFAWLRDKDDPDTLAYLRAENAYTDARTAHTAALREELFQEIKSRILETDLSVPVRKGPWWYYTRTVEGEQYGIACRRASEGEIDGAPEQVLVDFNEVAAGHDYLGVGVSEVSPDHRLLAYSVDFDGDEDHTIRVKDLETGEHLPDQIPNTSYGLAWAADNETFFYTTLDEARRPYRLWRHRLGTPAGDDVLLHQEDDERFFLGVGGTRSDAFVLMFLASSVTSEAWVLPTDDPTGSFRVVDPRRQGIEYHVDHAGDRFVILSNDGHEDFAVFTAPVDSPGHESWEPLWTPGPGTRVLDTDAFADHLVVHYRRDALTGLRVIPWDGEAYDVEFDDPVHTVEPGDNREFATSSYRFHFTSLVTPDSVFDDDVVSRERVLKKQQPVLGGYDPADYVQAREWATARDGARVPISLVHRAGVEHDGSAPCLLYGYGAYEASIDPWFSPARLSLLDRGVVFAIAHVRGGGEMGRHWYEDGKLLNKPHTFTDFVAAAEHLVAQGYTAYDRLIARGRSAGGLLMGATANIASDRFRAIVAEVPFVDALNSITDPTLPLTVIEWEEWGNPIADEAIYKCMKEYAPYENVTAKPYPAILATAGFNDPRVLYHEPAKWVARLRITADQADDRPILLKTELDSGHGGPSGRYDAWREEAFVLAFVLDQLGVA